MALISIPLFLSFIKVVDNYEYFNKLNSFKSIVVNDKKVELNIQSLQNKKDKIFVNLEVVSSEYLSFNDYNIIKNKLQETVDKQIVLKIIAVVQIN